MDILICEDLKSPALDQLARRFHVVADGSIWQAPERLIEAVGQAKVLVVRNQTQVTGKLLESAPKLIGIGRVGVGLDNIDMGTASKLGIVVVAPLNANATSVAELTFGLLLALARKIPQGDRTTKAGQWDRKGCTGVELAGKTLVICGLGRIGGMVAKLGQTFGMQLAAFDPFVKPDAPILRETGARLHDHLDEALGNADFVTVHLPLTADTKHLFNEKLFGAMKPGAHFINTSRGGVVDEGALLEALQSGRLAGAALDVREVEPPKARGALESLPNVILTPHIGAFTVEAQARTFDAVASDVERLLEGKPAVNFVNFERPRRA